MTTFDLTAEPWLPATRLGGDHSDLSLTDLFAQAHTLRDLGAANPLTQSTLYRLLLAVLHRAYLGPGGVKAWRALWRQGRFDRTIPDYLAHYVQRFDLFSATHPFHQTPGLATHSAPTSVSKLFHELACANNKTLFDHTLDGSPPRLTPAEAARALVTFQSYALGGGKSASSQIFGAHPYFGHAPLIQGAAVYIQGNNLFQTLLLNAVYYDPSKPNYPVPRDFDQEDLPVWERDSTRRPPGNCAPAGYLEYLTWTSRHIRLIPDQEGDDWGVSRFYMAQGESLALAVEDPCFAFRSNKSGESFPIKLQEERALWRDSGSLFNFAQSSGDGANRDHCSANIKTINQLAADLDDLPELRCAVIGLANNKAKPLLWRMEQLPLSLELLRDEAVLVYIKGGLAWVEEVGFVLREEAKRLAGDLLTAGRRKPDGKDMARFAADLGTEVLFWARLEPPFRRYLAELPLASDREERQRAWEREGIDIAQNTLRETTENALGYSARELRARVMALGRFDGYTRRKLNTRQSTKETTV
ncbi:MAG: type I-E CRISPR-associated protein Cse1/CasA [Chromatiaceae bacterium]|nr:type I-E CRISPR-associated protein Cse1/CasA [Chromatiaceae bacterium]